MQAYEQTRIEQKSLQETNKRVEDNLSQMKSEHNRLAELRLKDREEFSQRILKLEVTTETHSRELNLLKQMRMQLINKIESEVSSVKEMKIKVERSSKE